MGGELVLISADDMVTEIRCRSRRLVVDPDAGTLGTVHDPLGVRVVAQHRGDQLGVLLVRGDSLRSAEQVEVGFVLPLSLFLHLLLLLLSLTHGL